MINIALMSMGVIGMAFGRCWKWSAEKVLRDELRFQQLQADRLRQQLRVSEARRARAQATATGHPVGSRRGAGR